jgi:hypothetical protein
MSGDRCLLGVFGVCVRQVTAVCCVCWVCVSGDRTPRGLGEGSTASTDGAGPEFLSGDGPGAPSLSQLAAGPSGKAVVVSALLATGVDKAVMEVEVDTRRRATPASHRPLLDLDDIFASALGTLHAPQSITHPRVTLEQLVNYPNANGITPLHVAFGGAFGEFEAWCVCVWGGGGV